MTYAGQTELFTKTSHQFVDKQFPIVCHNILRHTISIDEACPDKIKTVLFLDFL